MTNKPGMGFSININSNETNKNSPSSQTLVSGSPETKPESPFHIAVMGNFSGRTNTKLKAIEIDRDNFDEVMSNFDIHLNLDMENHQNIEIRINDLEDFHPDSLYEKLESFEHLKSLKRRLKSKNGFASAAAEIQGWLPKTDTNTPPEKPDTSTSTQSRNLLSDILKTQQTVQTSQSTQIDKLIKSIVSPYIEAAADPRQEELISSVDSATETHMQKILHHTSFQAMESAWRSLYFLIKRLETGAKLKIFIFDISKQKLHDELSVENANSSAIYKLFCDTSEGDLPWSILLGNYQFSDKINDILLLTNMGEIAKQANAPFIAAAKETLTNCKSFSTTPDYSDWNHSISEGTKNALTMLRESPIAKHIGLALPRFLLRLPYGEKSKPIESFKFEEATKTNNHEDYLWGNAAFIKVECLARNFLNHGWNMKPETVFETKGFPLHYFKEDGETLNKPVAEITLTNKGVELINNNGLMAILSVKHSDAIHSGDYRSISSNDNILAGRWKH